MLSDEARAHRSSQSAWLRLWRIDFTTRISCPSIYDSRNGEGKIYDTLSQAQV